MPFTNRYVRAPMANVVMYSTRYCPFCIRARMLLEQKGVEFTEIAVDGNPELRRQMQEKSGRFSVPQIFINDVHVGGFTDMWALERQGELDEMLGLAD